MNEENPFDNSEKEITANISKSQKKRELSEIRNKVEELINYKDEKIRSLGVEEITSAVLLARRTTKITAKKRQIQYITKLIHKSEPAVIARLMNLSDQRDVKKRYHQLERWREALLNDNGETFSMIVTNYPNINRQNLQQLVRRTNLERKIGKNGSASKKLLQFLKELGGQ